MANNAINSVNYGGNTYVMTLPYGVCSTAAATAAKVVTVDNFSLETGAMIVVKFSDTNTATNPTLNVNSLGAKAIKTYGSVAVGKTVNTSWPAGSIQTFIYDGTNWVRDYNNSNKYEWTASVRGQTWSRLCQVEYANQVTGASYILNIAATRANVVYNDTFLIKAHHSSAGKIVKLSGHSYSSGYKVRLLADSNGNSYVELYDNCQNIATGTYQTVHCRLIPIYTGAVNQFTDFASGATLPTNYSVTRTMTVNNADIQADSVSSKNGIYYVEGNTSGTAGAWTGTNSNIPSLYTGLTIAYKIGIDGSSSATTLNLTTLEGASGVKNIKRNDSDLTTHIPKGSVVLLVYDGTCWRWADYDKNSYAYVRQYSTADNVNYPLLFRYGTGSVSEYTTQFTRFDSDGQIYANPSTGTIGATIFAGTATSASKLTTDAGGTTTPVYFSGGVPKACTMIKSGAWHGGLTSVGSDGVMEVGKYIDFHVDKTGTSDYDVRISAATTGLTISGTTSGTFKGSLDGNAATATKLATARTIQTNLASAAAASFDGSANITPGVTGILGISNGGTGANNRKTAIASLGVFGLYERADIGTSPNFDNPGVNGLFELRSTSETTGETGTKPYNGFGPFISIKYSNTMFQLAGTNTNGFYIRGKQAANITLAGVDWQKLLTSGNYTDYTVTKTGGGASGTWDINITGNANYATSAGSATTANQLAQNTRMDYGWDGLNYFNISGTAGNAAKKNDTPTSAWWHILRFNHANNNGYYTDLAVPFNANSLYYKRIANGAVQNSGWVRVLDALNYNSYAPKLDGTGASGTWGISITGTAGQISNITANDQASESATKRRIWFCYDNNTTGRPAYDDRFTIQTSTGTLFAPIFSGSFTGNVTGSVTGTAGGLNSNVHAIELNSGGTLPSYGGFIDFHFHNASKKPTDAAGTVVSATPDYTSRIIENAAGQIAINGVTIKGSTITGTLDGNAASATTVASVPNGALPLRLRNYQSSGFTDANAALETGFHYITANTNRPAFRQSTNPDYRILTTAYSDIWLQQIATDYRCDDIFFRRKENGTWKPWVQILTTGGMNGRSSSWWNGRDNALLRQISANGYSPAISIKTTSGSWEIGHYNSTNWHEQLLFNYKSDTSYAKGDSENSVVHAFKLFSDGYMLFGNKVYIGPNNVSDYGSLRVYGGAVGNYEGIHFGSGKNGMTIMSIDGSHQGLYNNAASKWIVYYPGSGACVGIGTAALDTNYNVTQGSTLINGALYVSNTGQHAIYTAGGFASAVTSGPVFSTYYAGTWYETLRTHGNGNLTVDAPGGSLYLAYYRGNTYFAGGTYYIDRAGYFNGRSNYANYLASHDSAVTTSSSSWDGAVSGLTIAWRESFKATSISSDTGDFVLGLRASQYSSGGTELCMMIDGDYYAMGNKVLHAGNYTSWTDSRYVNVAGDTMTGRLSVNPQNNTTSPVEQSIVLNGVNNSTDTAKAPGIGFHIGNQNWGSLKFLHDGSFRFYNSGMSGYMSVYTGALISSSTITATGWVWANGGQLYATANGNEVRIGSQNADWCHIYNSADIPFIFNKKIFTIGTFGIYNLNAEGVGSTFPSNPTKGQIFFKYA